MKPYDIIIVGAGGAGMYAAMEALQTNPGLNIAVVSKVYPTRSHTSAAQGGVNAALANRHKDDTVELHIFDTIKGSDYLADQDAATLLCEMAPYVVREMENLGAPFSRLEDGTIAQRPFGGAQKYRCCYCADRTGHTLLQTLFEQCMRKGVKFFSEYYLLSIEHDGKTAQGIVVMNMQTGKIEAMPAKTVIIATGGYAKMYWQKSSNAAGSTGDGIAAALRAGLALEDMEFVQFHPTGLRKSGLLISEGARGEGGYLVNNKGERFMSRYAPEKMELGPRDLVSRSIEIEINEGRGFDSDAGQYMHLDLRHLGGALIKERLPQIRQLAIDFEGVDPIDEPIPIRPTAHYSMGGIDADINGATAIPGIYAAGECSCISVHGANRLGGNSLLEVLVFGKQAGHHAAVTASSLNPGAISTASVEKIQKEIEGYSHHDRTERYSDLREDLGKTLGANAGIYRTRKKLEKGVADIMEIKERFKKVHVKDASAVFNTNLFQVFELKNMIHLAETVARGALAREESRGSHSREDFPTRDDKKWHKHSIFHMNEAGEVIVSDKPVTMGKHELQERTY
ncbi:MAG: FAD-dependent oxidoreductase [Spirochaetia bacterium]|nr:FAD-dependent oxidoreductase [Spirochaetia bacterium]